MHIGSLHPFVSTRREEKAQRTLWEPGSQYWASQWGRSGSTCTVMSRSTSGNQADTLHLSTHICPSLSHEDKSTTCCLLIQYIANFSLLPQSTIHLSSFHPALFYLPFLLACFFLSASVTLLLSLLIKNLKQWHMVSQHYSLCVFHTGLSRKDKEDQEQWHMLLILLLRRQSQVGLWQFGPAWATQ